MVLIFMTVRFINVFFLYTVGSGVSGMSGVVVRRGTRIVCPLCRKVIGEFVRDVESGELLGTSNIVIYGREVKRGDEMRCPHCGFPYCVDVKIGNTIGAVVHTERGWLPESLSTLVMVFLMPFLHEKGLWREEWDKYLSSGNNR